MYAKTIICLANSRKPPSGRCLAGREVLNDGYGQWIRPVSNRPTQEISETERSYEDGSDPKVLDLVRIPFIEAQPHEHQQENHLIDPTFYWERLGRATWADVRKATEDPQGPLWFNGFSSSLGTNDRVPQSSCRRLKRSLYLVAPEGLTLLVGTETSGYGSRRRRVRADFDLSGHTYAIAVTDPAVERAYLRRQDGEYPLAGALLCVSLGEVFHSYAYKLAAAVIVRADTNP